MTNWLIPSKVTQRGFAANSYRATTVEASVFSRGYLCPPAR